VASHDVVITHGVEYTSADSYVNKKILYFLFMYIYQYYARILITSDQ
jgi:hypothetical protein